MEINLTEIAKSRLINQQIAGTKIKSAVEMLRHFCAVQGQEYEQTKWGLGLRLPHLKNTDIEEDFNRGNILRTHLLRPTWHFVTNQDIRWVLELTSQRVHKANAYMYRKLELDSKTLNLCGEILVNILQGEKELTRDEINEEFKKNKIIAHGHRLSYIMMYAELEKIVCSGARRGNKFTYALFDERVKTQQKPDREESLAELSKRYFSSRGAASINDFSTWSGLTVMDCKRGVEIIKDYLETIIVDEIIYYAAADADFNKDIPKNIHFLPIYDEYIMAYKNRSAILKYTESLEQNILFKYDCMILFDGQITGTWKRTFKNHQIEFEYDLFNRLNCEQQELFNKAINKLGQFYEMEVKYNLIPNATQI